MDTEKKKPAAWKTDFPIKKVEASYVSRKEFLKLIAFFSGTLALANIAIPIVNYLRPKKNLGEHFLGFTDELEVGGMKTFFIDEDRRNPYMLIRLSEGTWKAFEQKCTHLSCAVLYDHAQKRIVCPCHKGYFSPEDGQVLQGPPPRPLPQLSVVQRGDSLYVIGYKRSGASQQA